MKRCVKEMTAACLAVCALSSAFGYLCGRIGSVAQVEDLGDVTLPATAERGTPLSVHVPMEEPAAEPAAESAELTCEMDAAFYVPDVLCEPEYLADVPLDAYVQDYIITLCAEYNLDAYIVLAIIGVESTYQADAVGDSGRAQGLMQVQSRWHEARMEELGVTDLCDPYQNVTVGIDFFNELYDKGYGITWALTAYNGGEARAHKYRESGEVSEYAAAVLEKAGEIGA